MPLLLFSFITAEEDKYFSSETEWNVTTRKHFLSLSEEEEEEENRELHAFSYRESQILKIGCFSRNYLEVKQNRLTSFLSSSLSVRVCVCRPHRSEPFVVSM